MRVGFIGLGNMGSAMARNLIKAEHQLTVYNRTRQRAESLESLGGRVASSPAEAASGVEVLITMLADDHAVEEALLGPHGAIGGLSPGAIHLGMSTISVQLSRRLQAEHQAKQQHYVAAPVFGRPDAAAAAKLFIVAAGPSQPLERCRSLFDAMGQKTFVVDEQPHAANLFKLTGNFLITTMIESLSEAFALVRKSGLSAEKLLEVLTESLFPAPIYRNYGNLILSEKFEPAGFKMPLGFKDNRLVMAAAEDVAAPLPLASLVHDRFLEAMAQGLSDADWSAISRVSLRSAGL